MGNQPFEPRSGNNDTRDDDDLGRGTVRARLRFGSGLIMLAFVVMHLTAHVVLLISFDWADATLALLMTPWRTTAGTALLAAAFPTHYANALWSIYVRRSLRMPRWELWQLALGLSIPLLLARHVVASRVSELALGTSTTYSTIMLTFWHSRPWLGILQVLALIVIWLHASIGIHFWLRTKAWYRDWIIAFRAFAVLLPTLALAGFVAAGTDAARSGGGLRQDDARAHPRHAGDGDGGRSCRPGPRSAFMSGWSAWRSKCARPATGAIAAAPPT